MFSQSTNKRRTDKRRVFVAVVVGCAVLGAVMMTGTVAATDDDPPAVPAAYYGTVTIDGDTASANVNISAAVNGTVIESTETDENGTFGGPDAEDEKLFVSAADVRSATSQNATPEDHDVEFLVDGDEADEKIEWESGVNEAVNLTVGDTSTGTGGGGGGGGAATGAGPSDESDYPVVLTDRNEIAERIDVPEDAVPTRAEIDIYEAETTSTFTDGALLEEIEFAEPVDGEVGVTELEEPVNETDSPPGTAIKTLQFSVPEDATEQSATVQVRLSSESLSAIDAESDEFVLSRFEDGSWEPLETTVVEETDDKVVIEAETPGFSQFAVSAASGPEAVASVSQASLAAGETIELDGTESTDADGDIVSYDWTVDDQSLTGETATTTLDEPGEYTVELTVTNEEGIVDTTDTTVSVEDSGVEIGFLGPAGIVGLILLGIGAIIGIALLRRRGSI